MIKRFRIFGIFLAAILAVSFASHAAEVVISEFAAINDTLLQDADGDFSDWIELHNVTTGGVDLTGWHLTDSQANPSKWTFPQTNLPAGDYLLVFASGKDKTDGANRLHTNFKLDGEGEYLALTRPDETVEVAYADDDGGYPPQRTDVSYGIAQGLTTVFDERRDCRALVPADGSLGQTWTAPEFDDSQWTNGLTGVGFELATGYEGLIGLDLGPAMHGQSDTAYIRVPFTVEDPGSISALRLRIKYDDGFVAYLNGQEVARANAPETPDWQSSAPAERYDRDALLYETFHVPNAGALLVAGTNMLAIHGLNYFGDARTPDFLVLPSLDAVRESRLYMATPTPGAPNGPGAGLLALSVSPQRGFYTNAIAVEMASEADGVSIRYTLDGSVPTTNSALYAATLAVTNTTILRARGFLDGYLPTDVATHTYLFLDDVVRQPFHPAGFPTTWSGLTADYGMEDDAGDLALVAGNAAFSVQEARDAIKGSLLSLPTLSIVMDRADLFDPAVGIYTHPLSEGDLWERLISMEYLDSELGVESQENAGLQIMGNLSRNPTQTPKHSLRILFKKRYGVSVLKKTFFGDDGNDQINTIALRANTRDSWLAQGDYGKRETATYARDVFAYETARDIGDPAIAWKFLHVYLNGVYWGVYAAVERPDAALAAGRFGGEMAGYDAIKNGSSLDGSTYTVMDGDVGAWSELQALANAGLGSNESYQMVQGRNPDGSRNPSYPVRCEIDSLIGFAIAGQYCGSMDWPGNWVGVHCREGSDEGFRFFLWDMDTGFYQESVSLDKVTPQSGGWWDLSPANVDRSLRANADYRLRFADRVHRHYSDDGPLAPAACAARWMRVTDRLRPAMIAESARWGDYRRDVHPYMVGPYHLYTVTTHWEPIVSRMLSDYFPARSDAVMGQLRTNNLYPQVTAPTFAIDGALYEGSGFQTGAVMTIIALDDVYYTTNGLDPRQQISGVPVGTLYQSSILLSSSVYIKARALHGGSEWSPLAEVILVPEQLSPLCITEIMYHPRQPVGSELLFGATSSDFEFVEIQNCGTQRVSLAGVRFTEGILFDFTQSALRHLDPGAFAVVVKNLAAFTNRYSQWAVVDIAGEFASEYSFPPRTLADDGEELRLVDGIGRPIARCVYGDGRGWPAAADGAGHSLVPAVSPAGDPDRFDYGGNWRASAFVDGSPGAADPEPVCDVVLNELEAHTDYTNPEHPLHDSNDWLELYNLADLPVALDGWYLSDDAADLRKWKIPASAVTPAKGWLVFHEVGGFHDPITNGFGLNKAGETIYLSHLPPGGPDRVVDAVCFKGQQAGRTWGRYPDGARYWQALPPTPWTANSEPLPHVCISRIMYHPRPSAGADGEYIEIWNASPADVPLWTAAGNWRLAGGVSYVFPSGTTLGVGERILLTAADSADATAMGRLADSYGDTGRVSRVLGPWEARLSDRGERVALEHPQAPDLPGEAMSWVVVDEVVYFDRAPWPVEADGSGRPLERLPGTAAGSDPGAWRAGARSIPLRLHWRFDEGSGEIAADSTGAGAHGELLDVAADNSDGDTAPVWIDGTEGHALQFDGVDDVVRGEMSPDAVTNFPFSLAAWVRAASVGQTGVVCFLGGGTNAYGYGALRVADGVPEVAAHLGANPRGLRTAAGQTRLDDGAWHHMAGVFASTSETTLWVDGAPEAWLSIAGEFDSAPDRFAAGRRDGLSGGDPFAGDLDDVRVYADVLWDDELRSAMSDGSPRVDRDADGMPDAWERRHFNGTNTHQGGPGDDWDGDGFLNEAEYLGGTDPTNREDRLALNIRFTNGYPRVVFKAQEASGDFYHGLKRFYALEDCTGLLSGCWWTIPGYAVVEGRNEEVTYTNAPAEAGEFFRVKTWLEE